MDRVAARADGLEQGTRSNMAQAELSGTRFDGLCILFDLDGTLIDTALDLAHAMNSVLQSFGRSPLDPAAVRHLVGHGARAMLEEGFRATGAPLSGEESDRAVSAFLAHYGAHIADHSVPFPGAVRAMDDLRSRGASVAICTNKREGPARQLISALAIEDRFAAIVGGDSTEAPKPDPAPVRRCLEQAGARSGVFVGDSDTDIRAAQAAGLPMVLVSFGYGPTTLAAHADRQIDQFADLVSALEALLEC